MNKGIIDRLKSVFERFMSSPPGRFFQKFSNDQVPNLAALIAYNALFSMFPILLSIITIASFVFSNQTIRAELLSRLQSILAGGVDQQFINFVNLTASNADLLAVLNIIILLWSGSGLIGSISLGLNTIFRVKQRDLIPNTLINFGMIIFFAIFAMLAIASSGIAAAVTQFGGSTLPGGFHVGGLFQIAAGYVISFIAALILVFVMYLVLPNTRVKVLHILPGAVVGAALLVIIIQAWPLYVSNFGSFNRYGALIGLFLLVMTWFYFVGIILLVGAELNSFLFPQELGQDHRVFLQVAAPEDQSGQKPQDETKTARLAKPDSPLGKEQKSPGELPRKEKIPVEQDLKRESATDLIRRLFDNMVSLVERQIDMAKAEAKADLMKMIRASVILIGGAVLLFIALIGFVVAIILALSLIMPGWLAAVIVGVVFAIIGAGLALWGKGRIPTQPMQQTRETLQEDLEWIKHPMTSEPR